MDEESHFGIGELAELSGLTRRAIRFYVQRELLQPPTGRGRGRHYSRMHLERLRAIQKLQAAGHSLDAIRRILNDQEPGAKPKPELFPARKARADAAQLWLKIPLADGAELLIDTTQHILNIDQLAAVQRCVADILLTPSRDRADNRESQS